MRRWEFFVEQRKCKSCTCAYILSFCDTGREHIHRTHTTIAASHFFASNQFEEHFYDSVWYRASATSAGGKCKSIVYKFMMKLRVRFGFKRAARCISSRRQSLNITAEPTKNAVSLSQIEFFLSISLSFLAFVVVVIVEWRRNWNARCECLWCTLKKWCNRQALNAIYSTCYCICGCCTYSIIAASSPNLYLHWRFANVATENLQHSLESIRILDDYD